MMNNKKRRNQIKPGNNILIKDLQMIILPKPKFKKGKTVFEALKQRKTTREIRDKKLSMQELSNLLWAANGVNRQRGPFGLVGRTAASASNSQEIDIFVALPEGIYLYDPINHRLMPKVHGDFRKLAIGKTQSKLITSAPVQLIYVVDIDKFIHTSGFQEPGLHNAEVQKSYYFVDTGLIAGNVYLYSASQSLAVWFHNCDKEELKKVLKLRPKQKVLFGQTIGYAVKNK
jgi:hypothetical protein